MDFVWDHEISIRPNIWAAPNWDGHSIVWLEEKMALFKSPNNGAQECDMVILGHLHEAYIDNFKRKTILNVGSVGNPLDIPQATYGIIEGEYNSRENGHINMMVVRVEYDVENAIQQAIVSEMPELDGYIKELTTAKYRGNNRC